MINFDDKLIIFSNENKRYEKLPIEALGTLFVLNATNNSFFSMVENKIYELSLYILELSADFVKDYYSIEELDKKFELQTDTIDMSEDPIYLVDPMQIEVISKKYDLVKVSDAENAFDKAINSAEKELATAAKHAGKW